ncbi:inositol monophosphatase family protein [Falsiroseomonas stagni]|uniref:Myo-inositol-1(Or 4)-monophosphatase n=1 Tax=Falsiroseomonas stagni DSM 19981 TaxID=1123062 RepID=A0A1I4B032_9PROT|nr:inositol monophosphatase family protein [Falsiroseomonas stagni]SFK61441.1 myo-inositol-1(or 4)-monophosphatase [Falsiroseomonas stagni DSM 19981]
MSALTTTTETRALLQSVANLVTANLPTILAGRRDITWKPDGSPVTTADVFVEQLVRDHLSARLPDLSFVGEESFEVGQSLAGRNLALLDPIDGTENFCSGLREWGVSLGLWRDGLHLGSLLMLPELGDQLMSGDRIVHERSRINGFSSSYNEEIGARIAEVRESRIFGCAVYNLYNVARGAFSRFSNPKGAYAWDLLPGLMLALEQGCDILVDGNRFDGQFLEPHRRYRVDVQHRYDLHPG